MLEDHDDEDDIDEEEVTEGRLDFGSISSSVNEGISSVGSSVTSGVDVSGWNLHKLWKMGAWEGI